LAHDYFWIFSKIVLALADIECRISVSSRRNKMSLDDINDVLNQLADEGTLEPMIEPIDDPNNLTDFWDWADVVGIVDEFAPLDDPFWGVVN